jgi:hypothetical protein
MDLRLKADPIEIWFKTDKLDPNLILPKMLIWLPPFRMHLTLQLDAAWT